VRPAYSSSIFHEGRLDRLVQLAVDAPAGGVGGSGLSAMGFWRMPSTVTRTPLKTLGSSVVGMTGTWTQLTAVKCSLKT
jgi:hypothetical protein